MLTFTSRIIAGAVLVTVACASASAQQPPVVVNGRVTTSPAGAAFPQSFRNLISSPGETTWVGYAVPVVDRARLMCCDGSGREMAGGDGLSSGGCRLESSRDQSPAEPRPTQGAAPRTVQLEGSDRIAVLFRVVARSIERIRVVSADCVLDAGGRPVMWVEGVRPAESVALLESLALAPDVSTRVMDGAVMAIALHGDESADTALDRLVNIDRPETVRKKVTFWLGNARGQRGFDRLRRIMREDPSIEVRKSAIFGLSQSPMSGVTDTLASIARSDSEPRLRSEALFWLAQAAGRRAAETITERIEQDPDTEVKKKAVFALSQLPRDEGVPLLINVARTNTNPAVRKQAMFWLGQSKDPRAIDFFTDLLK
jgi:hypothetical protein